MKKEIIKNVEFIYEDFCDGCNYHDFEVITESAISSNKKVQSFTTIQCKNLNGCRHAREGVKNGKTYKP